ncbi:hypothetical protein BPSY_1927 [Bifidobacterium psychraerophilum]|uniref:Uncharacterized protein n=2 Tax=Bifidobacterium psychraerophilum TaxID=218140 RepID=A0A087CE18_9BIFI|nr:hypothetical protein BPSY_1927 [Bifidobacterium psychraerophilum]
MGHGIRAISKRLACSVSSISREIRRNTNPRKTFHLRPVNKFGGNGMSYNEPYDFNATILGYPSAASDPPGNTPFVCRTKMNAFVVGLLYRTVEASNCDGKHTTACWADLG